jgi:hypothetical protein
MRELRIFGDPNSDYSLQWEGLNLTFRYLRMMTDDPYDPPRELMWWNPWPSLEEYRRQMTRRRIEQISRFVDKHGVARASLNLELNLRPVDPRLLYVCSFQRKRMKDPRDLFHRKRGRPREIGFRLIKKRAAQEAARKRHEEEYGN